MGIDKKYALLDTDFLYKSHLARNAHNHTLSDKSEMQDYYDRLSSFLKNQKEYKVWSVSGHQRMGVPIRQVFDEMYDGRFRLLRNGDLQYIE